MCSRTHRGKLAAERKTSRSPIAGQAVLASLVAVGSAALLDQGGALEELGWRGYLLPRLDSRFGLVLAAVWVGLIWSLWHVPRDLGLGVVKSLGG